MATNAKKLAVFDIDGTIFRSSLLVELLEGMIEAKFVPKVARSRYLDSWQKWQNREGGPETGFSYTDFIEDVIAVYRLYIKGQRRSDIWKVADKVIEKNKSRTYRYTRDLVHKLKKDYYMLAISNSPYEAVSPFARNLGFDKVYAQIYEIDEKVRFTGKELYNDVIKNKDKTLLRAVDHNNLNLINSIGVGETAADIPFLKLVTKAIAFNPSMKLYKEALKQNLEIVVERKDVVYHLRD